jgi:carbon storage regulator
LRAFHEYSDKYTKEAEVKWQNQRLVNSLATINSVLAISIRRMPNMLVFSRKKNESIVINNDITVTVVEIRDDKVRLGLVAPKNFPIHRQEVYDAIVGQGGQPTPSTIALQLVTSAFPSAEH